jgi:hypothetical protein
MGGYRTNSGENLKRVSNIPAIHVRYHKDGTFFMPVDKFPAAFCDPNGYILFKTKEEYEKSQFLDIGDRINIGRGVWKIPGYIKDKVTKRERVININPRDFSARYLFAIYRSRYLRESVFYDSST